MRISFSQTCLVRVRIGAMPAFDMQFYGLSAQDLADDDTRFEIVASALRQRGFDLLTTDASFSVGVPTQSPVKARNNARRRF